MSDAKATVRFAIRDAIAETAHLTGLRAGTASERLIDAIYREITSPHLRWATHKVTEPSMAETIAAVRGDGREC
jgi:hypothetical protein